MLYLLKLIFLSLFFLISLIKLNDSSNAFFNKLNDLSNVSFNKLNEEFEPIGKIKPFLCRQNLDKVQKFLIHEYNLFIYFKSFLVILEVPKFYLSLENELFPDIILKLNSEPLYQIYEGVEIGNSILNISRFVIIQKVAIDKMKTYLIKKERKYKPQKKVYEINFNSNKFLVGQIDTKESAEIAKYLKNLDFDYFLIDEIKFFKIFYKNHTLHFNLKTINLNSPINNSYISEKNEIKINLGYKARFSAYKEVKNFVNFIQNTYEFAGILFEIDNNEMMHLNYFAFSQSSGKLKIDSFFKIKLTIEELLNCNLLAFPITEKKLKGIFYDEINYQYFIFINHNYIVIKDDLYLNNFKITSKQLKYKKLKKMIFNEKLFYDKNSIKYIKNTGSGQAFIAIDDITTYVPKKLASNSNLKSENDIVLQEKPDRFAHRCHRFTFKVDTFIFCFEEEYYYFVSKDDFETYKASKREKISDLFAKLYNSFAEKHEKIRSIFYHRDDTVVFMSSKFQYRLKMSMWSVKKLSPNGYSLILKNKNESSDKDFEIRSNCLFYACDYEADDKITSIALLNFIETYSLILIFAFILVLFVVVFLVIYLLIEIYESKTLKNKKLKKIKGKSSKKLKKKILKRKDFIKN